MNLLPCRGPRIAVAKQPTVAFVQPPHRCPPPTRAALPPCRAYRDDDDNYASSEGGEMVSSLQNPTVKHCVKVRTQRPYREASGTVIVAGADLLTELAPHVQVLTLFHLHSSPPPDLDADRIVAVTDAVMRKITGLESVGAGAVASEVRLPRLADFCGWETGRLQRLLVLDRCQDPGNMGTLLRTALALGWDGVYLLPGCADPFNDKSMKASRGAAFKLPIAMGSMQGWREVVKQHSLNCIAAEPHRSRRGPHAAQAVQAHAGSSPLPVSLVLGSEGQGVTPELLQHCVPVAIPMPGDMESLNVAVAGALFMFALSESGPQLQGALTGVVSQAAASVPSIEPVPVL